MVCLPAFIVTVALIIPCAFLINTKPKLHHFSSNNSAYCAAWKSSFLQCKIDKYWGEGQLYNILTTADEMYEKQMYSFVWFSVTTACEIYPVWVKGSETLPFSSEWEWDGTLNLKHWIGFEKCCKVFVWVNTYNKVFEWKHIAKPEVFSCRNEIMHVEKACIL